MFWAEQRASAAQGTSARRRRAAAAHTTHLVRAVDHLERRHGGWSRSRRLEAARPTPSQTAGSAHRSRRREVAACCCGHSRLRRRAHSATLDKVCEASFAVCFSLRASRHLSVTRGMGKKPAGAQPPGQQPSKAAKRPAAADAADIDALFAQLPKRNARAPAGGADSAAADAPGRARGGAPADGVLPSRPASRARGGDPPARRDRPVVKGRSHFLDSGERLVPVRCEEIRERSLPMRPPLTPQSCDAALSAPRRFEDGLPVYKSFDDFSDLQAVRAHAAAATASNTLTQLLCLVHTGPSKTTGRPSERGEVPIRLLVLRVMQPHTPESASYSATPAFSCSSASSSAWPAASTALCEHAAAARSAAKPSARMSLARRATSARLAAGAVVRRRPSATCARDEPPWQQCIS